MKKILVTFCFLIGLCCNGQDKLEVSLQQDIRLFTVGDDHGNDPLTINLLSKFELPVYNLKKSYISTYISIEYADLSEQNYKRFALGAAFNIKSIYKKIGAGVYTDFGKIYREKQGYNSFSFSGELNYKISEKFKLICTAQFTHREDLKMLYNNNKEYLVSGFLGIKYSL